MRSNQFEGDQKSSVSQQRKIDLQRMYPDLFGQAGNIVRGGQVNVRSEDETDIQKLMGETHTYVSAEGKYQPMREDRPKRKPTPNDIELAKSDSEN